MPYGKLYEKLDDRFGPCMDGDVRLEQLYGDCRWAEGPVYVPAGRYLAWSDIPNDRMLRWDEITGEVGVLRSPAGNTNGHTLDRSGRLVSCEHGNRRVSRTEYDGSVVTLADRFEGKRFNSPNDVVVHSDDSIWFTDPTYGIRSDYEGWQSQAEIGAQNVYRLDPATGECRVVEGDMAQPNGLAFSLDEKLLYVSDSERNEMRLFDVGADGTLSGSRIFATCTAGCFDGFRLDNAGRIWTSAADGVHCYDPDGTLLGKIVVPETVANVVFGGLKRNHLFICATTSVYALKVSVTGAKTV
ncbi:MAG TPA: SMP-30/gluconolactonase/LRE family protein [Mycobacteriales bacterium]|nr:SMP-30/gluconolactonase/LRE family protein [Mycobacteriales bacterium]